MIFTINDFDGPLDLLLHLVKLKKQDINNIDIAIITKAYLDFINQNRDLSIDIASEYLVMASELIHLKSKSLLNKNDEPADEYEFNDGEELQRRLLEYELIKTKALDFKELEARRAEVYTRMPSHLDEYREDKTIINSDLTLNDLMSAFEQFLKRQRLSEPLNTKVTHTELSVEERSVKIRSILKQKGKVKFLDLFDDISKPYVVVTFLSILDMTKNNEINITQKNNFSDIFVEWGHK